VHTVRSPARPGAGHPAAHGRLRDAAGRCRAGRRPTARARRRHQRALRRVPRRADRRRAGAGPYRAARGPGRGPRMRAALAPPSSTTPCDVRSPPRPRAGRHGQRRRGTVHRRRRPRRRGRRPRRARRAGSRGRPGERGRTRSRSDRRRGGRRDLARLRCMPLGVVHGLRVGMPARRHRSPVDRAGRCRAARPRGRRPRSPGRRQGSAAGTHRVPVSGSAPSAMGRSRVAVPLSLGVRALDTMATVGRGQRIGLFAGSGVGSRACCR